ncbi:hypothetical protein ICM_05067 [Bacillus cereus BAG1X2-3]|uniref:DUF3037 domain-containing protein n=1 Tax=Bacillus cereus TaxID=1396 RepID=UPI00032DEE18|nr:DUF3037 domain-containing protein [Bacillus cereus]EOO23509.1 hypothetical protein ICC_05973 [Bacillus cereus BAG1X1-1]EOO47347.1 hypothetical protein ICK_05183 [Bacillus cereus BAG1X2-2]EOO54813.1 hypothetical protein ICI_00175 [Bacillus cereus BAG1X2-1]EOO63614.1 hypothetical protein ICM_05067 [Bacillus cereus BAG1X2-3]EOP10987.1 hypothetical protein ICO_00177 [Bacillus cereus BAG2O-1]
MDRRKNWYSVIRYMPDVYKGEVLNVGLIQHSPDNGKLQLKLLEHNNYKLKSLLYNQVLSNTYKVQKENVEYFFSKTQQQTNSVSVTAYSEEGFLSKISEQFPEQFILSKPSFSFTNNEEKFFNIMFERYVGKEFINNTISNSVRTYVKECFNSRNFIETKVKCNAKIYPIKEFNDYHFLIDFVYKNGIINYLQSVPGNKDTLNNWFNKMNTFINDNNSEIGIHFLYNNIELAENKEQVESYLSYLSKKDSRVNLIDVHTPEFLSLCDKIEIEGKNLSEFEHELLVI